MHRLHAGLGPGGGRGNLRLLSTIGATAWEERPGLPKDHSSRGLTAAIGPAGTTGAESGMGQYWSKWSNNDPVKWVSR